MPTASLETTFTRLVGCTKPVQTAPMGPISSNEVVVEATKAGAMAMVADHMAPPDAVAAYLDRLNDIAPGPIGMNFLMPVMNPDSIAAAAERTKVVDFFHADPASHAGYVTTVHQAGALAGWQVTSTDDARAALDIGCDVLVVRGVEGGGRMYGTRSLWPLLAEVLDVVNDRVPVLATGGIATGRLLAAALAAGAAGVRIGTRIVATAESGAHDSYKQAIVDAPGDESVVTERYATGWPSDVKTSRVLQRSIDAADATNGSFAPSPPARDATDNVDAMPMYAGESSGAITSIDTVASVIERICADAAALLDRHR